MENKQRTGSTKYNDSESRRQAISYTLELYGKYHEKGSERIMGFLTRYDIGSLDEFGKFSINNNIKQLYPQLVCSLYKNKGEFADLFKAKHMQDVINECGGNLKEDTIQSLLSNFIKTTENKTRMELANLLDTKYSSYKSINKQAKINRRACLVLILLVNFHSKYNEIIDTKKQQNSSADSSKKRAAANDKTNDTQTPKKPRTEPKNAAQAREENTFTSEPIGYTLPPQANKTTSELLFSITSEEDLHKFELIEREDEDLERQNLSTLSALLQGKINGKTEKEKKWDNERKRKNHSGQYILAMNLLNSTEHEEKPLGLNLLKQTFETGGHQLSGYSLALHYIQEAEEGDETQIKKAILILENLHENFFPQATYVLALYNLRGLKRVTPKTNLADRDEKAYSMLQQLQDNNRGSSWGAGDLLGLCTTYQIGVKHPNTEIPACQGSLFDLELRQFGHHPLQDKINKLGRDGTTCISDQFFWAQSSPNYYGALDQETKKQQKKKGKAKAKAKANLAPAPTSAPALAPALALAPKKPKDSSIVAKTCEILYSKTENSNPSSNQEQETFTPPTLFETNGSAPAGFEDYLNWLAKAIQKDKQTVSFCVDGEFNFITSKGIAAKNKCVPKNRGSFRFLGHNNFDLLHKILTKINSFENLKKLPPQLLATLGAIIYEVLHNPSPDKPTGPAENGQETFNFNKTFPPELVMLLSCPHFPQSGLKTDKKGTDKATLEKCFSDQQIANNKQLFDSLNITTPINPEYFELAAQLRVGFYHVKDPNTKSKEEIIIWKNYLEQRQTYICDQAEAATNAGAASGAPNFFTENKATAAPTTGAASLVGAPKATSAVQSSALKRAKAGGEANAGAADRVVNFFAAPTAGAANAGAASGAASLVEGPKATPAVQSSALKRAKAGGEASLFEKDKSAAASAAQGATKNTQDAARALADLLTRR